MKILLKTGRHRSIALVLTLALSSGIPATANAGVAPEVRTSVARPAEGMNDTLDAIVQSLLEASSRDFYTHQPPLPVAFRNVKLKFLVKADVGKVYMLCGQFLAQDDPTREKWTDFATIKTSDYEQWIGSNAAAYCQDAEEIPYGASDLSSALKSRVDSIK